MFDFSELRGRGEGDALVACGGRGFEVLPSGSFLLVAVGVAGRISDTRRTKSGRAASPE
jgi:hypothetical protein